MPAKSKAQQKAAGAELARRRAGKSGRKFNALPTKELRKFAATKRKGLPRRVAKG